MATGKNRQLYEQWVADYSGDLYRFAYRLMGNRDQAEELTQETFFHAWRSMHTLKDENKSRAWLYQIMRYRFSHTLRTKSRRPQTTSAVPVDSKMSQTTVAPLDRMTKQEAVQHALDSLDERFRMPFLMVFAEGLTCREAAEELDVPLGTVLSRIHRARKTMKQALETVGYGEEDAAPVRSHRLGGTA